MSLLRSATQLIEKKHSFADIRYLSNKSAIFAKNNRKMYLRTYDLRIVNPDGSSYTIRYPEPLRIIKLPLDINSLSESEKAEILEKRKPKKKVVIEDEIEDDFNSKDYLKYFRKKKAQA